jgi:hypothetical protein
VAGWEVGRGGRRQEVTRLVHLTRASRAGVIHEEMALPSRGFLRFTVKCFFVAGNGGLSACSFASPCAFVGGHLAEPFTVIKYTLLETTSCTEIRG